VPDVALLGVRHHGPGSARSVRRALDDLRPDVVVVELPADTAPLLPWATHVGMVPPVALLAHGSGDAAAAAFLPFAEFSPEWQALQWAHQHQVPVVPFDLPMCHQLVMRDDAGAAPLAIDPLAELAAAAGEPEAERWWDDVVEHRGDGAPAFESVAQAMAAVRGDTPTGGTEAAREAHMRTTLRRVLADGATTVAVVCGAWHVPALGLEAGASTDRALLRGLPKTKVDLSWVPWTHERLASATGYGAGVVSPAWYAHVYRHPGPDGVARWFVDAARLLRADGMSASPDHLIAATRAATALAALRGRPRAGLAEVLDAADTVMAGASGLALIRRLLVVGDAIGDVPPEAPAPPLARDLAARQRRLRLQPVVGRRDLELDVRTPNGRARSVLLHQIRALDVPWGSLTQGRGSSGTFRESWVLDWQPEFAVRIVERSAHGTTVPAAATSRLLEAAHAASTPGDLVAVLEHALLADLPDVVAPVAEMVARRAADHVDVVEIIDTMSPLARAVRYGDVRATDASSLRTVFDGMLVRVLAGVVVACRSLDDDAAQRMVERLTAVQAALALVDHPARGRDWPAALSVVCERSDVHGLVQGRATRLLHDATAWNRTRVGARLSRALSPGTTPAMGAAFVEGFVAGSGTVLVHDRDLLDLIDAWLSGLAPDAFDATMPLLRRTFGAFEPAERRQLGLLLDHREVESANGFGDGIDPQRAAAALVTVRQLLGVAS